MSLSVARLELEEAEAQKYAQNIRETRGYSATGFWAAYNKDIAHRMSWTALERIKRRAWQIVEAPEPTPDGAK